MYDPLARLIDPPGIRHIVVRPDLYCTQARLAYLAIRIRKMELTLSSVIADAEDRVMPRDNTWSQLIFTDLFGPELTILADLARRIECLEGNLVRFRQEARELTLVLEAAGDGP
ncbi:MAG: hypothetical protein ABIF71_07235 [Planctomycetota bacterium]